MSGGRKARENPSNGPPGIESDVRLVREEIEALRVLASGSESAKDSARIYDFSIRWGAVLSGRLKRLEHYHEAEELTQAQESHYRELRRELEEISPLAGRLGLARPAARMEDQVEDSQVQRKD